MSDTNLGNEVEKPFHDGPNKTGRLSRLKKLAIILLISSVSVMTLVTLFSLVSAKSGSGFVIELDHAEVANHFTMSALPRSQGGQSEAVLMGDPLGNAWTTSHKNVRDYYDEHTSSVGYDGALSGSWNYKDADDRPLAMFYTFYLTNQSDVEEQPFRIACRLNSELAADSNGNRPYDYVRLALFLGEDGSPDDTALYFAAQNAKGYGTETDPNDTRECLAQTLLRMDDKGDYYRVPGYSDTWQGEKISFCEAFAPGNDRMGLFDVAATIAPSVSLRVTFAAYLEGNDPDCDGSAPKSQKLGFSLHIGI